MKLVFLALAGFIALFPVAAVAGVVEVSAGFSFNQSNYSADSYSWNRRWGMSIGYHLTDLSEVELSFQDVTDRTNIIGYEDTTFHDQIFAVNWVQSLTGKNSPIQPYFKIGVGQLNREASGLYWYGASPPAVVDAITGIIGAGLRVYLTKNFGLRGEASSYLSGGSIGTWKDNVSVTFGLSVYF